MDTEIMKSIEERREVVRKYYDLPPEEMRKTEEMFARMEQVGKRCRNRMEFERKLATQTMEREYNLMLMEISAYVKTDINFTSTLNNPTP